MTPPAAGAAGATAPRAPTAVEPFDSGTWSAWQALVRRQRQSALVVFSATWCTVCPGVIQRLAADERRRKAAVPLWVVVTDLAPGEDDAGLLSHAHYRAADRVLAFDGPSAALQHAVDPRWRGVMPTVAWLSPDRPPEVVQGEPAPQRLAQWLAQRW